ncbi:MAG: hypothetical protein P8Q94_00695 [Candidatus Poseidoniaceae archaeon]|nr:hypothetical protein [Candidatus Poseidoniaceae archaeon]
MIKSRLKSSCIVMVLLMMMMPISTAQDQVEIPSWELGWETNMDGTHELELSGDDDILDMVEFFVENQRMTELNLRITITWDESEDIPIDLDYDESITVAASENITFEIEFSDVSGYSFERSPDESMTLVILAEEISFDQPVSSQEIDAEMTVPAVYNLEIDHTSMDEVLYAGSSIEYGLTITNNGNGKDVIKMPAASIKSCPSLSIEGLEAIKDTEIDNSTTKDFAIRIVASESHPERMCEVTISIKSAGNGKISSSMFEIQVNSNEVKEDDNNDANLGEGTTNTDGELTEANTLSFLTTFELFSTIIFALMVRYRK